MFFLVGNTFAARTQVRSGARTSGKSSHDGRTFDDDDFATLNLCNLDQSCLDNLADDVHDDLSFFFQRDLFAKRNDGTEHCE